MTVEIYRDTLFEAYLQIVKAYPLTEALNLPDGCLCFSELDSWSDQVAVKLLEKAVPVVGLFFHPSLAFYVSVVACMKVGVIAQLLDPAIPFEQSAGLNLDYCLSSADLLERAYVWAPEVDCLVPESASEALSLSTSDAADLPLEALHRIVTSGSSGAPTTVTIGREAVYLHFLEMADSYLYAQGRTNANLTRHTSAAGINGFWRVLLSGATFMTVDMYHESLDTVYDRLQKYRIQTLQGVGSLLEALAKSCQNRGVLETAERVIFGGEALTPFTLKNIANILPEDCAFSFNYSSSETLQIAVFNAALSDVLRLEKIPCGLPLPSRQIDILGPDHQPVPQGISGEIVVTADLMALEIVGANTQGRMRACPNNSQLKVYHTRDRGRWNHLGQLEYLGRMDRQLKINGVRIDPIQIEHAIEGLDGISKVVVLGLFLEQQKCSLVACLVRDPELATDEVLYRHLSESLAASFMPSRLLDFAALPILPSGKTDIQSLESQCLERLLGKAGPEKIPDTQHKTPLNLPLAELLRLEWSQALGRDIASDPGLFIHEGGDSLKAAILVTALGRRGFTGLSLHWIAAHPSFEDQLLALAEFGFKPFEEVDEGLQSSVDNLDKHAILERLGWL